MFQFRTATEQETQEGTLLTWTNKKGRFLFVHVSETSSVSRWISYSQIFYAKSRALTLLNVCGVQHSYAA